MNFGSRAICRVGPTMRSSAVPVVDKGGSKFLLSVILTLAAAGVLVFYRRRYRGLDINNVALI